MKQIIVIPARMSGSRLPGKPLIKICGKTLIEHVFFRCNQVFNREYIFVATEDKIIEDFCKTKNINCVNTGPAETAIDRIKLFSDIIDADSYINIQGDEPLANLDDIKKIIEYNLEYPDRVVFGKSKVNSDVFFDYSKAKVVCDINGKLLYTSRGSIPLNKNGKFVQAEKAVWLYAFPKSALDLYYNAKDLVQLEKIEELEIIRFLEIGYPVYCIDLIGDSWAVDEEKDVKIIEQLLKARGEC